MTLHDLCNWKDSCWTTQQTLSLLTPHSKVFTQSQIHDSYLSRDCNPNLRHSSPEFEKCTSITVNCSWQEPKQYWGSPNNSEIPTHCCEPRHIRWILARRRPWWLLFMLSWTQASQAFFPALKLPGRTKKCLHDYKNDMRFSIDVDIET